MQIAGLDVGTTGTKITVYESDGRFLDSAYREYDVTRAHGAHEIDANVIWEAVLAVITEVGRRGYSPAAIGVTTFGETFVALDEHDEVLLPSMLYTDPRGEEEVKELIASFGEEKLTYIAGVKPHAMFSLPKLMWIKNNRPEIFAKIKRVLLAEDYVVYRLSGEAKIDYSLAARTMALDIRARQWSKEIFAAAGIDPSLFSTPVPTGSVAGLIRPALAKELGLSPETRIVCGCHDQVAAAVGSGVFTPGEAVDGTGTVECITPMFDHIPEDPRLYDGGYSVVPYVFPGTYVCYAFSFTGGATLKWYRDNFARYEEQLAKEQGKKIYAELDAAAPKAPTDILILPHFAGAATPYMDNGARAVIAGLTLSHTNLDIYRALMEGVTYEIRINIEQLESFGIRPRVLYAVGGGASSPLWLSIKADVLGRPVTALEAREVGACGTAMMCAVAMGACADLYEAKKLFVKQKETHTPNAENSTVYEKNYKAYQKMYAAMRPIIAEVTNE